MTFAGLEAGADSVAVAFVPLTPTARVPARATAGAVGYDLHSDADVDIEPGKRALVSTGVSLAFPASHGGACGMYARIAPRSGLAVRGIDVAAGVCDSDYRGEYKVVLVNNSAKTFAVRKGDRIAQLIFELVVAATFVQTTADALADTARADGGFGSTGQGLLNAVVV